MATENIIMEGVKAGGDRQELHEKIRVYSHEASFRVKSEGLNNNLLEKIANDKDFGLTLDELNAVMDAKNFIGRAPSQVIDFIEGTVNPLLEDNKEFLDEVSVEINV